MKWLDNYQKVKQLKEALVWLPVWERDKRAHVPEVYVKICIFKHAMLIYFDLNCIHRDFKALCV